MKLRRSRVYLSIALIVVLGGAGAMAALGISPQLGLDLEGGISVTLTAISEDEIQPEVLEKTVEIIRQRLDALGGFEPEVSAAGTENIFIQLPGVEDEEAAVESIGTTAQLTFRQVEEIIPTSADAEPITEPEATADPEASSSEEPEKRMPVLAQKNRREKKKDRKGDGKKGGQEEEPTPEPSPSPVDPSDAPEITEQVDSSVNDEEVIYPDAEDPTLLYRLKPAALTGDVVTRAEAVTDPNTGAWSVSIDMDDEGAKIWAEFTGKLACLRDEGEQIKSQVAIVLDGVVESAAGMKAPGAGGDGGVTCPEGISGGQTQIDSDNQKSAKDLALVLKTGALPLTLEQSEIQKISPTLGRDSLNAGLLAGLLGLVLVMIYMVLYYKALGFVVWAGLLVFTSALYTVTCLLSEYGGFTLSLAGIAGVIVSVGVTADSYIVAFERLKDEARAGKSLRAAVDRGMSRAFKTILVADFVTGSAAVILFWLAVGSVKGFALTLGLATIIDVLVAYFFTRPAVVLLARNKKVSEGRLFGLRRALGLPAS